MIEPLKPAGLVAFKHSMTKIAHFQEEKGSGPDQGDRAHVFFSWKCGGGTPICMEDRKQAHNKQQYINTERTAQNYNNRRRISQNNRAIKRQSEHKALITKL